MKQKDKSNVLQLNNNSKAKKKTMPYEVCDENVDVFCSLKSFS